MSNTIGDYTAAEIAGMDPETFKTAQAFGFSRARVEDANRTLADEAEFSTRPAAAGISLGSSAPKDLPQPSANVWASKQAASEDFTCPSGQTCRLTPLKPEVLLSAGILDRVTRLEGLANELAEQAEGQRPQPKSMPTPEDFQLLLGTINLIVPLAVAEPKVYADDDKDAPDDAIRVSDIDLEDRMAIMERALRKVKLLDSFRQPR